MHLLVTEMFWTLFPEPRLGVVTARGLDSTAGAAAAPPAGKASRRARAEPRTAVRMAEAPACLVGAQP